MKNPSIILRGIFIASIGFLLIGVLFTVTEWPAANLFSVIGAAVSLVLYCLFSWRSISKKGSIYPRHAAFGALVIGQVARSFGFSFGTYFFLIALIAVLIWIVWSVLEELPSSEE